MERQIIREMPRLLEKTGMDHLQPAYVAEDGKPFPETTLVNLKNLNARYEKDEAISQVHWLMDTYNIQIEEVIARSVN